MYFKSFSCFGWEEISPKISHMNSCYFLYNGLRTHTLLIEWSENGVCYLANDLLEAVGKSLWSFGVSDFIQLTVIYLVHHYLSLRYCCVNDPLLQLRLDGGHVSDGTFGIMIHGLPELLWNHKTTCQGGGLLKHMHGIDVKFYDGLAAHTAAVAT